MEILSQLFGSETKVKLMRLFIFNPDDVFEASEVADRLQTDIGKVRKELAGAEKMGLIKRKMSKRSKRVQGFSLNSQFGYLAPLQTFLINSEPLHSRDILQKILHLGSIKVVLVAGVFIQDPESRLDLLIVGDGIRSANLERTVKSLEAEIGKELKYAYFSTEDFKYRLSMYDKLTRDVLDYPHKLVLDKLGIA